MLMPLTIRLPLALALLLLGVPAAAQRHLGELLDDHATMLSTDEFKRDVVGRSLVGPTATGGTLEVTYATDGQVSGTGSTPGYQFVNTASISGTWSIDDNGKMCSAIRIVSSRPPDLVFPRRCQWWFKKADQYFLSDSDLDRDAKVLLRGLKQ